MVDRLLIISLFKTFHVVCQFFLSGSHAGTIEFLSLDHAVTYLRLKAGRPASTRRPMDVQWMFGCYVQWTCQNMF